MKALRYELGARFAVGGMAEVFLASAVYADERTKTVVVKRILPQFSGDPNFIDMFLDEAMITGRLDHPNIVRLHDFGRIDRDLFLALEYVPGMNLEELVLAMRERNEIVPMEVAVFVVAEVLAGLHHAHERRDDEGLPLDIVHRDVTPANVLLGLDGAVKVTDFGIARAAVRYGGTRAGVLKGNFQFMAPEQAMQTSIDRRADVYGAGMVLRVLLTGQLPFDGDPVPVMIERVARGDFPTVKQLNPNAPDAMDALVRQATAREPAGRFPTALAFREKLLDAARSCGAFGSAIELKTLLADVRRNRDDVRLLGGSSLVLVRGTEDEGDVSVLKTTGGVEAPPASSDLDDGPTQVGMFPQAPQVSAAPRVIAEPLIGAEPVLPARGAPPAPIPESPPTKEPSVRLPAPPFVAPPPRFRSAPSSPPAAAIDPAFEQTGPGTPTPLPHEVTQISKDPFAEPAAPAPDWIIEDDEEPPVRATAPVSDDDAGTMVQALPPPRSQPPPAPLPPPPPPPAPVSSAPKIVPESEPPTAPSVLPPAKTPGFAPPPRDASAMKPATGASPAAKAPPSAPPAAVPPTGPAPAARAPSGPAPFAKPPSGSAPAAKPAPPPPPPPPAAKPRPASGPFAASKPTLVPPPPAPAESDRASTTMPSVSSPGPDPAGVLVSALPEDAPTNPQAPGDARVESTARRLFSGPPAMPFGPLPVPLAKESSIRFAGHRQSVGAVAFATQSTFVSAGNDQTVRVWDLQKPVETACFRGHTGALTAVATGPGGVVVSGSRDKTARVWKIGGDKALHVLKGHEGWVFAVAVSPDGLLAASGSVDKTLRLWDLGSGEQLRVQKGHTDAVSALSFLADGRLVSASYDQTLRVWSAAGEETRILAARVGPIRALTISPDGLTAISAGADGSLRVWDLEEGELQEPLTGHEGPVVALAFVAGGDPGTDLVASASYDGTVRLWHLASREEIGRLRLDGAVTSLAPAPQGGFLGMGNGDGSLALWAPPSGA